MEKNECSLQQMWLHSVIPLFPSLDTESSQGFWLFVFPGTFRLNNEPREPSILSLPSTWRQKLWRNGSREIKWLGPNHSFHKYLLSIISARAHQRGKFQPGIYHLKYQIGAFPAACSARAALSVGIEGTQDLIPRDLGSQDCRAEIRSSESQSQMRERLSHCLDSRRTDMTTAQEGPTAFKTPYVQDLRGTAS